MALGTEKDVPQGVLPPDTAIIISFFNYVDDQPLHCNETAYTNTAGETLTISKFLYYISNIELLQQNGKVIRIPSQYFLVDAADSASRVIHLPKIPTGTYAAISWTIGVDSIKNVSGAQAGALAPENGMFWTWNSGYIMAKMEGHSKSAPTALNEFQLHVGGFKSPYNSLRKVKLTLTTPLIITKSHITTINIKANAAAWFHGTNVISLAEGPIIMAPGAAAIRIADNYQYMFSVLPATN
ncbi:MbnP family protein [Chitinophaga sp. Hz27]|uniref:MbnP family protein n=1 Tax=Chitinophaga sp. Hz27 TaxID=3347169 RepID=UPI0035DA1667